MKYEISKIALPHHEKARIAQNERERTEREIIESNLPVVMNESENIANRLEAGLVCDFTIDHKSLTRLRNTFTFPLGNGTKYQNSHYSSWIVDKGGRSGTNQYYRLLIDNALQPAETYRLRIRVSQPIEGGYMQPGHTVRVHPYIGMYIDNDQSYSKPQQEIHVWALSGKSTSAGSYRYNKVSFNQQPLITFCVMYPSITGNHWNEAHVCIVPRGTKSNVLTVRQTATRNHHNNHIERRDSDGGHDTAYFVNKNGLPEWAA